MLDTYVRPECSFQITGKRITTSPVTLPVKFLGCPRLVLLVLGLPYFETLDKLFWKVEVSYSIIPPATREPG